MKIKFLISFIPLFLLFNCSVNSEDNADTLEAQDSLIYQWHLTNVSGGIAGVDIDFETDTVIWVFSVDFVGNGSLQVENNNTESDIEDGLDTGTYSVSIPVYDEQSILFINGEEFAGVVTPSDEDLVINQNIKSNGTGSDGFIYTFKRKIVRQDS